MASPPTFTGTRNVRPDPRPAPRADPVRAVARPVGRRAPRRATTGRLAWRRRIALFCVVFVIVVIGALAFAGGRATAGDEAAPVRASAVYVVRPGDSLWSIAERLAPDRDPRASVAALKRAAGTTDLQPGQRIVLPPSLQR